MREQNVKKENPKEKTSLNRGSVDPSESLPNHSMIGVHPSSGRRRYRQNHPVQGSETRYVVLQKGMWGIPKRYKMKGHSLSVFTSSNSTL